uniref:Methyltransferase FkbM domain-containing protein n=1 Tax=viral metagenome TaxID=1070528 RepID=A0A6C0JK82_9ZZZZ
MKILYGTKNNNIDVTEICNSKLMKNSIIKIPCNDITRAAIFTDPCYGTLKIIMVIKQDNSMLLFDYTTDVYIDTNTNEIYTKDIPEYITSIYPDYDAKLRDIHKTLKIGYGSFEEEYPEQTMAVRFLTGNEKVLEIGSNIGRNSLIINHILSQKNNNNFVTLESDTYTASILKYNRDLNGCNFHIENAALSKRRLLQKGWNTICSDVLLDGYKDVNTITLEELNKKYNIEFDTLILDCEGAFYYILIDMPEILNNINLIIMENDYHDINHKKTVDEILKKNNFYVEYSENGCELAKQIFPQIFDNFYEVWKRKAV